MLTFAVKHSIHRVSVMIHKSLAVPSQSIQPHHQRYPRNTTRNHLASRASETLINRVSTSRHKFKFPKSLLTKTAIVSFEKIGRQKIRNQSTRDFICCFSFSPVLVCHFQRVMHFPWKRKKGGKKYIKIVNFGFSFTTFPCKCRAKT